MAGKITELGRSSENGERKNMGAEVWGEKALLPIFSLAVFLSYAPTSCHERLEEANLFLVTHVSIIFRPKSFSGRG